MLNREDYIIIAKYLYKYASCLPSIAVKQLLNIDIFRNNYSKNTIYNMIMGTRRALKEEKRSKYFAQTIYHIILDIKHNRISKEFNGLNTNTQKPKEISIEQRIEDITNKKEKLKIAYKTATEEKEKLIEDIETATSNKISEIQHELGILSRAYSKAEMELDTQLVSLNATLLLQQTNT